MKLIFCLPGRSFSARFLACWSETLLWAVRQGHEFKIAQAQSNNIYMVRSICLGADVTRGKKQKPYGGQLPYDYLVWIDSDTVWQPQQIERLLAHGKDIVGGLQLFEGGGGYTCGRWDEKFFKQHGYMPFLKPDDVKDKTDLLAVDYTGFGLLVVKYGVFEALSYPWFEPIVSEIDGLRDLAMEDVSWSLRARKAGYTIHIDPTVRIGHEKTVVW